MSRAAATVALVLAAALAAPAAGASPPMRTTKAPWSRPNNTLDLARSAGLEPERHEFFAYHVHAHLDILVDGRSVRIPAGIGIDITVPGVQRGRAPDGSMLFGGIRECSRPCIAPLHTHDATGILHTESQRTRPNHLGQFFVEWRVRLTRSCVGGYCRNVRVYVDGKRYPGDLASITLTNRKEIAIVIGKRPAVIPSKFP